jgi:hypothetical protein
MISFLRLNLFGMDLFEVFKAVDASYAFLFALEMFTSSEIMLSVR